MRDRSRLWPRLSRLPRGARVSLALGLGAAIACTACAALVGLDKDYTDCGASPCADAATTPTPDVATPPPDASDGATDARDAADASDAGPACPGFADASSTGVDNSMIQFPIPPPSSIRFGTERYNARETDGGIAYDSVTGLTWERFPEATPLTGQFTFDEARSHCANLRLGGYSDWRVPTRGELISLTDYRNSYPSLDLVTFPRVLDPETGGAIERGPFWTSTVSGTDRAWAVSADDGNFNTAERDCPKAAFACQHVRCVR